MWTCSSVIKVSNTSLFLKYNKTYCDFFDLWDDMCFILCEESNLWLSRSFFWCVLIGGSGLSKCYYFTADCLFMSTFFLVQRVTHMIFIVWEEKYRLMTALTYTGHISKLFAVAEVSVFSSSSQHCGSVSASDKLLLNVNMQLSAELPGTLFVWTFG